MTAVEVVNRVVGSTRRLDKHQREALGCEVTLLELERHTDKQA